MKLNKTVLKFIATYFVLVVIFLLAVFASCLIPSSFLSKNIGRSVETFQKEGSYPSYGFPWRQIVLDNYTDSLMLNTAYSVDSKTAFKSSMITIRHESKVDSVNQIENLRKLYLQKPMDPIQYERYWHGYLFYLRPLLLFVSYGGVRVVMSVALYSSLLLLLYLLWKRINPVFCVAFILGLMSVDFFYLGQSMQFTNVFLIGILSSIFLLLRTEKKENKNLYFFIVGAVTSFVDLLTAPLVTLGMLLTISTSLKTKKTTELLLETVSWSIGYLALWYTKWLVVQTFFIPGAVKTAFNEIVHRTVKQADQNFSHLNAVKLNFFQLVGYNRVDKIIVLFLIMVGIVFFIRYHRITKERFLQIVSWIGIGLVPYIWYFTAANHSYLHVWFTYRDQFMSVVSLIMVLATLTDTQKLKNDWMFLGMRRSKKSASKDHNYRANKI